MLNQRNIACKVEDYARKVFVFDLKNIILNAFQFLGEDTEENLVKVDFPAVEEYSYLSFVSKIKKGTILLPIRIRLDIGLQPKAQLENLKSDLFKFISYKYENVKTTIEHGSFDIPFSSINLNMQYLLEEELPLETILSQKKITNYKTLVEAGFKDDKDKLPLKAGQTLPMDMLDFYFSEEAANKISLENLNVQKAKYGYASEDKKAFNGFIIFLEIRDSIINISDRNRYRRSKVNKVIYPEGIIQIPDTDHTTTTILPEQKEVSVANPEKEMPKPDPQQILLDSNAQEKLQQEKVNLALEKLKEINNNTKTPAEISIEIINNIREIIMINPILIVNGLRTWLFSEDEEEYIIEGNNLNIDNKDFKNRSILDRLNKDLFLTMDSIDKLSAFVRSRYFKSKILNYVKININSLKNAKQILKNLERIQERNVKNIKLVNARINILIKLYPFLKEIIK